MEFRAKNDGSEPLIQKAPTSPRATVSCRMDVAAPWGIRLGGKEGPRFHMVTGGSCWFRCESMETPIKLSPGDLVVLSREEDQELGNVPNSDAISLDGVMSRAARSTGTIRLGGTGDRATIVSGTCIGDRPDIAPVRVIRGDDCPANWHTMVRIIDTEMASGSPGALLLASQLASVMLSWICWGQVDNGTRIGDRIAGAVIEIHAQPDRSWSVDELAGLAVMSRSGFSSRFRALTGESPMQYLQRCRLARAAGFLEKGQAGLLQIAAWTGYQSDVALSKAFKKRFGVSPGGYRKAARISGQRNAIAN